MTNSLKLGMCAAFVASLAFMGCGDDDDSAANTAGTSGSGGSGGGTAGSSNGGKSGGGSSAGGSAGSSAGKSGGGSAGTTAGSGGSTAGSAGTAGTAGTAGNANLGGSGSEQGGAAGEASSLGGSGDAGGAGNAGGAPATCVETDDFGSSGGASDGAGGAAAFETAIVLIDNVVVKDAAAAVKTTWAFADATSILDDKVGDVGDKWVRFPFDGGSIGNNAGAHDVFAKCDGNPKGSLKAVVPFTAASQYYELGIGFANANWANYTVSADVKLVSGGNPQLNCPAHGELFINGGGGSTTGASKVLTEGQWVSLTLAAPAAGAKTAVDHLAVRITSYACL